MPKDKILITGASGQIGTELSKALVNVYGAENVIATDIKDPDYDGVDFVMMDILNAQRVSEILDDYRITQVYHLAAILSASGEWNPQKTWNVNMGGLLTILQMAVDKKLDRVFYPSSIAVFGGPTPKVDTPQDSPMIPTTVYGMSKLTGELWCNYYHKRFGLDVRSVRYPGIISYEHPPGGGTTDYAVEIFHEAIQVGAYTSFLRADTRLPMLYMPDAIRGTLELMQSDQENIHVRTSYNLAGMSFTPEELADAIQAQIPEFKIDYEPDFRQAIADSWTESIDDTPARKDWGWKPQYDLKEMTKDMIEHLKQRFSKT